MKIPRIKARSKLPYKGSLKITDISRECQSKLSKNDIFFEKIINTYINIYERNFKFYFSTNIYNNNKKKARLIFMEIYLGIEEYKDSKYVGGYRYYVSNLGNVKNNANEVLKQRKDKDGYMIINLHKDGKCKTHRVHRLVISAFKANPENKAHVNHINEDKTDNRLNNLSWATPAENNEHGTRKERTSNANKIKVKCIELDEVFDSAKDAAIWLGNENARSNITKCCKNKQKSALGYTWKYVNPKEQITVTNKPVFNITTNTKYANAVEASKAYGQVKTDYIYKACRFGNTCGNCQWCFYEPDMENWDADAFLFIWD